MPIEVVVIIEESSSTNHNNNNPLTTTTTTTNATATNHSTNTTTNTTNTNTNNIINQNIWNSSSIATTTATAQINNTNTTTTTTTNSVVLGGGCTTTTTDPTTTGNTKTISTTVSTTISSIEPLSSSSTATGAAAAVAIHTNGTQQQQHRRRRRRFGGGIHSQHSSSSSQLSSSSSFNTTALSGQQQQQQQQDPIIAAGFGTKRDLQRLVRELNLATGTTTTTTTATAAAVVSSSSSTSTTLPLPQLPSVKNTTNNFFTIESIQYMMERRGRGIPKNDTTSTTTTAAAAPPPSAWDDFMKEAGMTTTTTTTTLDETTSTLTAATTGTKRGRNHNTTNDSSSTTTTTTSMTNQQSQQRNYDLDALQLSSHQHKKSRTVSTTTKNDNDTTANGGILVQTGTIDVSVIGRASNTTTTNQNSSSNHKKMDWEAPYTLSVPTRLPLGPTIRITKVITAGHACHSLAISTTGIIYGWGRNEQCQLGSTVVGLGTNVYQPTPLFLSSSSDGNSNDTTPGPVRDAAVGKGHTIILFENGHMMASGSNKSGQCGINNSGLETVSNFRDCVFSGSSSSSNNKKTGSTNGPPCKVTQVACGEDFSIVLDTDGYMYSCGSSEYGQLGNGETGQYFVCANKLAFANATSFVKRTTFCYAPTEKIYGSSDTTTKIIPIPNEDIRIQRIACGKHHSIALEANSISNVAQQQQPRVFTWGCGDYGVLGHGIQADEYYPRNVGALSNLHYTTTTTSVSEIQIAAGQHCSLLQTSNGHVYYWGKHRSVGEATMRPTLVDALANNGHVVSQIGAGGQTVVCCTQHAQTVAWGQGMYGELGFGTDKKSSSKPSFVPGLEGCQITSLACGYGTTLFVVRDNQTEEDQTVINQLPTLDPLVIEALTTAEAENDADGTTTTSKPAAVGRKGKSKK